jgi:vacuolar-type H+-ATPase subunit I/STV1
MIVGINDSNDEDCMYGLIFALFGLLLVAVGVKLNASINSLGVASYLKMIFSSV